MSSPDQEHRPEANSLDAERARLRSAGYTDAEISQILIQRAGGGASPQQPAAPSSGALSGPLSSLVAVAAHARTYVIGTKTDLATLFGAATPAARARAGGSLILKAIIVAVLGYAALQEWMQHIVYPTQQSAADTYIKTQDALAKHQTFQEMTDEARQQEAARRAALPADARKRLDERDAIIKRQLEDRLRREHDDKK